MEHDLRTLLDELQICWSRAQVKMIMHQLCSGMQYLHDRWIIHRDLKSSNLLLNNRGSLKIADFGMARYMSTTKDMTGLVVTLWYRAPEILLGEKRYGPSLDMWSIGCIFGELHKLRPIFRPRNEVDALAKIFSRCGMPTKESWPGFRKLPNARDIPSLATARFSSTIPAEFGTILPGVGVKLLTRLLSLNPDSRPSAQEVLNDDYFKESPRPEKPSLFPTYPSKAGNEKKRRFETPHAPVKGDKAPEAADFANLDVGGIFAGREKEEKGAGFNLRLV